MSTEPVYSTKKKRRISAIWIVPIIALIIGIGLMINEWRNRGVPITIEFSSAGGLAAGKSELHYRDVVIGTVESIEFSEDQEKIIVGVSVNRNNKDLLTEDSQLWVVKPRFSSRGISGVDTLISGSYLQIQPGTSSKESREFVGLEAPPITPVGDAGLHITLSAIEGNDIAVGVPVIYHGIVVGRVEQVSFSVESREVEYDLFINAPYDALVTSNTVFWQANGVRLRQSSTGFEIDIASMQSLMSGGIEFDVPDEMPIGYEVQDYARFKLYSNENDYVNFREYESIEYLMEVTESVRGLNEGAPVEFRGYRIGTVHVPELNFAAITGNASEKGGKQSVYIVIRLEPGRVLEEYDLTEFKQFIDSAIKDGLYASIDSLSLITGARMVNLDYGDKPVDKIARYGDYELIPSREGGFSQITDSANKLLNNLNALPIEQTINEVNSALASLNSTLKSADSALNDSDLSATIKNVNASMASLNTLISGLNESNASQNLGKSLGALESTLAGFEPNSELYRDLTATVAQLRKTLDDLSPFVNQLSRRPEMLIFGKDKAPDRQPKARTQ